MKTLSRLLNFCVGGSAQDWWAVRITGHELWCICNDVIKDDDDDDEDEGDNDNDDDDNNNNVPTSVGVAAAF